MPCVRFMVDVGVCLALILLVVFCLLLCLNCLLMFAECLLVWLVLICGRLIAVVCFWWDKDFVWVVRFAFE